MVEVAVRKVSVTCLITSNHVLILGYFFLLTSAINHDPWELLEDMQHYTVQHEKTNKQTRRWSCWFVCSYVFLSFLPTVLFKNLKFLRVFYTLAVGIFWMMFWWILLMNSICGNNLLSLRLAEHAIEYHIKKRNL